MYKKKYTFQWIGHGQHSFILVIKFIIFQMTVEQKVLVISSGVEGREPGEKIEILKCEYLHKLIQMMASNLKHKKRAVFINLLSLLRTIKFIKESYISGINCATRSSL